VYFAYYPGDNGELGHYPEQSRIQVGAGTFAASVDHRFVLYEANTDLGDSGGGYFNEEFDLVGIHWGTPELELSGQSAPHQVAAKVR
jgi:hypothetical protein